MSTFFDTLMMIFFLLFMIFIFAGYHKTKSQEREKGEESKK